MSQPFFTRLVTTITKIAWAFFFISLPVTSFPFFSADVGGKALVRPLSIFPLGLLVILVTIPRLIRRPLPRTFLPLLAFVLIVLMGSVTSFTAEIADLRGVTAASRFIRNLISLGIGISFYVTLALLNESQRDLNYSLKWLYVGLTIALIWGSLQIVYVIHFSPTYFRWMNEIQSWISMRKLFPTRISGMTYEPKWFAEQICFLYFPWLLGAVLSRRSIFQWRYRWLTVEWLLLIWATVVLVFTYSRTGLFTFVLLILLGFLLSRTRVHMKTANVHRSRFRFSSRLILEIVLLMMGLTTLIVLVGSQNPYMSRMWRYYTEAKKRSRSYFEYVSFQQRFIYWETAYRMYQVHPILGVGLGNYAFYFDEMLPNRPLNYQKEIIRQVTPVEGRDRLITPKNLFARLLAETGLLGTISFTTFVLAIVGCILYLRYSSSRELRYWGLSGALAMVVFLLVTFSFDSFTIPNMWVIFGLITAAAHLVEEPMHTSHQEVSQE